MNIYTLGDSRTILVTLKRNGIIRNYYEATSIAGSFVNFKYKKLRSSVITGAIDDIGADWVNSIVALNFNAASISNITDGEILKLRVKVSIGLEILTFYSVSDYQFIADAS